MDFRLGSKYASRHRVHCCYFLTIKRKLALTNFLYLAVFLSFIAKETHRFPVRPPFSLPLLHLIHELAFLKQSSRQLEFLAFRNFFIEYQNIITCDIVRNQISIAKLLNGMFQVGNGLSELPSFSSSEKLAFLK